MLDESPNQIPVSGFAPCPRQPKNWAELFAITLGRRGVSIEEFARGRVDWHYSFDTKDQRRCGRKGCEHRHADGYLIALDGGGFVHIGQVCARKYGQAYGIRAKIDAYDARRDTEARSKALSKAKRLAREKREWLSNAAELHYYLALIDTFERETRGRVLAELEKRAARNEVRVQRAIALSEDEREALSQQYVDGTGRTRTVRHERAPDALVAVLRGLPCLAVRDNLRQLVTQLETRLTALEKESPAQDDKRAIRALMKATDELAPAANNVLTRLADAKAFFHPSNLANVVKLPVCRDLGITGIAITDDGQVRLVRS